MKPRILLPFLPLLLVPLGRSSAQQIADPKQVQLAGLRSFQGFDTRRTESTFVERHSRETQKLSFGAGNIFAEGKSAQEFRGRRARWLLKICGNRVMRLRNACMDLC